MPSGVFQRGGGTYLIKSIVVLAWLSDVEGDSLLTELVENNALLQPGVSNRISGAKWTAHLVLDPLSKVVDDAGALSCNEDLLLGRGAIGASSEDCHEQREDVELHGGYAGDYCS